MLKDLEGWLAEYPNLIAFLSAFGTIAAVIVAICLAYQARYSKVTAYTDLRGYVPAGQSRGIVNPEDYDSVISVSVVNHGPYSIYLSYFNSFIWRVPCSRIIGTSNPEEPDFRTQDLEVLPGKSVCIVLSTTPRQTLEELRKTFQENDTAPCFLRCIFSMRFQFLQSYIRISSGQIIQAKVGKSLREIISQRSQ